jgi:hypothetical protein
MKRLFGKKSIGLIVVLLLLMLAYIIAYQLSFLYRSATQEVVPAQDSYQAWQTITNEQFDFSISFPISWRVRMFPNGNHDDDEAIGRMTEPARCNWGCIRLGDSENGVYIARKEISNPDIDDVANWAEERIATNALDGVYELDDIQTAEVNGQTLWVRPYLMKNRLSGEMEPAMDSFVLREQDAFILTLDVFPQYYEGLIPVFYEITSHFRSTVDAGSVR